MKCCTNNAHRAVCPLILVATLAIFGSLSIYAELRMNENDQVNVLESDTQGALSGDQVGDLLVFLHVSDIHVSIFRKEAEEQLRTFAEDVVGSIEPRFVVATGDLVDGHDNKDKRGGAQIEQEWTRYRGVLEETGMIGLNATGKNLTWLDTRGNHGTYGSGLESDLSTNLYERFGASSAKARGEDDTRTWRHDIALNGGGVYRIVGLDASTGPGVAKPFNFYGYLGDEVKARIMGRLEEDSKNDAQVKGTLLVGHHPDQSIVGGLGSEIRDAFPYYLCGHLHTKNMQQRLGKMIELEIDDMKLDTAWRLLALDQGQLSFSDNKLGEWPVGIITNPKNAQYLSEQEPFYATSTHIRVVAYTSQDASITSVDLSVDGTAIGTASAVEVSAGTGNGLYTISWDPSALSATAQHTVTAVIVDSSGRETKLEHLFSLDGNVAPLERNVARRAQAMGDSSLIFRIAMGVIAVANAALSGMIIASLVKQQQPRFAALEDKLVLFLAVAAILMLFLPFMVGFFMTPDGPLCFVFTWGIVVAGQGLAIDAQATLFGALLYSAIMTPALYYCLARSSSAAAEAEDGSRSFRRFCLALTGDGRVRNVSAAKRTATNAFTRWGTFLSFFYFGFIPLALVAFLYRQFATMEFVVLSPATYFLAAILTLIGLDFSKNSPQVERGALAIVPQGKEEP